MTPPLVLRLVALAGLAFSCVEPIAQGILTGGSYALTGQTTGGAGTSVGGSFGVVGAIATAAAGTSRGAEFAVVGGAPEIFSVPLGDFALEISMHGAFLRVAWPVAARSYILESAPAVGSGALWRPVAPAPTQNFYDIPPTQPTDFYRLRR